MDDDDDTHIDVSTPDDTAEDDASESAPDETADDDALYDHIAVGNEAADDDTEDEPTFTVTLEGLTRDEVALLFAGAGLGLTHVDTYRHISTQAAEQSEMLGGVLEQLAEQNPEAVREALLYSDVADSLGVVHISEEYADLLDVAVVGGELVDARE